MASDGGSSRHGGRHEVRAATAPLTAFEIAVAGAGTAFARFQTVVIHGEAHGAARLAPLEPGLDEDLVEALGLGLCFTRPEPGTTIAA
jgi:hypothetical protein